MHSIFPAFSFVFTFAFFSKLIHMYFDNQWINRTVARCFVRKTLGRCLVGSRNRVIIQLMDGIEKVPSLWITTTFRSSNGLSKLHASWRASLKAPALPSASDNASNQNWKWPQRHRKSTIFRLARWLSLCLRRHRCRCVFARQPNLQTMCCEIFKNVHIFKCLYAY